MNVKIPKDKVALVEHISRIQKLEKQETKRKNSENKKKSKRIAVYCRVGKEEQLNK